MDIHKLFFEEDPEDDFGFLYIPRKNVLNLNQTESKLFFQYYEKFIDGKYDLKNELDSHFTIVVYGFLIYCNGIENLEDKVYNYFVDKCRNSPLKNLLTFLRFSYKQYIKKELKIDLKYKLKFAEFRADLQNDDELNWTYEAPEHPNYEAKDIYINLEYFISEIFNNSNFIKNSEDYGIQYYLQLEKENSDETKNSYNETLNYILKI